MKKSGMLRHIDFEQAIAKQKLYKQCVTNKPRFHRGLPDGVKPREFLDFLKTLYEQNSIKNCVTSYKKEASYKIPAIIHQIWFGGDIPANYLEWHQQWRDFHPNWQCIQWDEASIAQEFSKGLYNQKLFDQAKLNNNYAKMSDIVRYEILHKFGGIYVDYDVQCFSSFDPLHQYYTFFAGLEDFGWCCYCGNAIIASTPQHPILQACLNNIKAFETIEPDLSKWKYKNKTHKELLTTILTTGPKLLTHSIWEAAGKQNNVDIIFPQEYMYAKKPTPISLCQHKFDSTWIDRLSEFYNEANPLKKKPKR